MIEYSDYGGKQDDVTVRNGEIVPFDREAARAMAEHAHHLAAAGKRPTTDSIDPTVPLRGHSDLTAA